jgi:thiol-disulfide isomerase/thioredoxin
MNLFSEWSKGLSYSDFLAKYGKPNDLTRWQKTYDQTNLSPAQKELLAGFKRQMPVLCLAGAWCGDCANQCPIFARFAEAASKIDLRFLDRDDHADVQKALQINGGNRVPVVVYFSEDGFEVARYGERTLAQYRSMAETLEGAACPTGINPTNDPLPVRIVQGWLDEFERAQIILRLSPRLRKLHRD